MWPMLVVMAGIDAKHVLELPPAEDEQAVEALTTHAADPALGVGVRVRRLHGRADHRNPFAFEDVIATATELRVAIVNEEAESGRWLRGREPERSPWGAWRPRMPSRSLLDAARQRGKGEAVPLQ
jgi:hypothetical protein